MADIKLSVGIKPFPTPNFAVVDNGAGVNPSGPAFQVGQVSLTALDASDLSHLCDEFRAEIFRKAGKPDPHLSSTR